MEEMFSRGWDELIARDSGPLHVRLILQPLVATVLAIRSGLNDAREDRPGFFWTLALKPDQRRILLRHLWKDVGKLFLVSCALDVIYQLLVQRWVYPVQTVIVATVLAILPYLVFRGLANRLGRLIGSKDSEKDGER
jgi:hypothetical protein